MVLGGEEGLECEVCVNGIYLEHVLEFKYLGCVLDESGTDETECSRKVASGRRVAGAVRFLVNARSLQLKCARVLPESLLVLVFMYGSETMIWRENNKVKIYILFIYLLYFNQFPPPPQGRHISCHEMNKSRRLVKLKVMKKNKFSPLCSWPQMDFHPSIKLWQLTTLASC